jgi:hypothetical protein
MAAWSMPGSARFQASKSKGKNEERIEVTFGATLAPSLYKPNEPLGGNQRFDIFKGHIGV